jgi:hypothetical protein
LVKAQLETPGYLPGEAQRRPDKLAKLYAEAWTPAELGMRWVRFDAAHPEIDKGVRANDRATMHPSVLDALRVN